MNAIEQAVRVLTVPKPTHQEWLRQRRKERNRDYYERNREIWRWFNEIKKLRALHRLLTGETSHANH